MFSYSFWAAAGISFIFLMTLAGSATVFLFPRRRSGGMESGMMGFSAGVMTAAAIWSLLIPAIEQSGESSALPPWLPAATGLMAGAMFIAALDIWQRGAEGAAKPMLFAAVTLHNIPEGMAVGLAFALALGGEGLASALALAFGIGVQNFPEGAAVSLPMSGLSRSQAFFRGLASGAVEPVAAVAAMLVSGFLYPCMPWLLSFSAGAMLYVSAGELLRQAQGLKGTAGYMLGFCVMMVLDLALG